MTRALLLDASFVMLLAALPLISFGTVRENTTLWVLGLVLLLAGFLVPLLLRFIPVRTDSNDEPDVHEEPS
jgi:hypothetical protein